MGAAAAVILRKERDIVQLYRSAGATDAQSARAPDELGVARRVPFNLLVKHAVLREANEGRYYLDELSWQALRRIRRRVAIAVFVLCLLLFLVGVFRGGIFIAH
jgi:hypothetical protein